MTTNDYNACVHELSDRLYRYARGLVSDPMDAEDLVQIVFERLWKHRKSVQTDSAKAYLYKSVQRASIDLYRKKGTRSRMESSIVVQESIGPDRTFEHRELINAALKELNEKQRHMVLLRDYEGYSYQEIADMMDLTLAQVKTNLFRARKKLHFFLTRSKQLADEIL